MIDSLQPVSPWCLGAPLYMPANRRDIIEIANGEKFSFLKSMIFCTEDAISPAEVDSCVRHLGLALQGFKAATTQFRFIRARNPEILARLLALPEIDQVHGFVLPKFNSANSRAYLEQLEGTSFKLMPTLETREVFDYRAMQELRDELLQSPLLTQITMLRIGGNDLMNLLGMRRPRDLTLYSTPLGQVIAQLMTIFKPYGFELSAPVFEYMDEPNLLQDEIRLDLAHGLTGKTAIHPEQVLPIEAQFAVSPEDYEMALQILDQAAPAVFKMHSAMCEVATHRQWAQTVLNRHRCYGVKRLSSDREYAEASQQASRPL